MPRRVKERQQQARRYAAKDVQVDHAQNLVGLQDDDPVGDSHHGAEVKGRGRALKQGVALPREAQLLPALKRRGQRQSLAAMVKQDVSAVHQVEDRVGTKRVSQKDVHDAFAVQQEGQRAGGRKGQAVLELDNAGEHALWIGAKVGALDRHVRPEGDVIRRREQASVPRFHIHLRIGA